MFLKCGHPTDCEHTDAEGETVCRWCDEVENLKRTVEDLRAAIEGRAVVVRGGEVEVVDGPIDYLAVYGGVVNCGRPAVLH